jgi:drug/metabolite transporter (DMT)-like permease
MPVSLIILILTSVMLTSIAQLMLKVGASNEKFQDALASSVASQIVWAFATSPYIFAGLSCFGLSLVLWIFVLSKIDVSYCYPFISLGIVATVAAGYFFLGESLTALRVIGVSTIVFGVLLVALG